MARRTTLRQVPCTFRELRFGPTTAPCDRCGHLAARAWEAERVALDLALEGFGLLLVRGAVYRCRPCAHYFRARPPFLRPDGVYTNRVVAAAVHAVFDDGMAVARVPDRLARDFGLRPSEATVRAWCRAHADGLALDGAYERWVVGSFSGVLCVDEVYQDRLALLVAVDPAAPEGDRLVGYELVTGSVEAGAVETFLERLRKVGIEPAQVVTDGSALYPGVVAKVWPRAAHQLCLFHQTRWVVKAVRRVVDRVRSEVPKPPSPLRRRGRMRHRYDPSRPLAVDRDERMMVVASLQREGHALRAIVRLTGHSRNTIRAWVRSGAAAARLEALGAAEKECPTARRIEPAPPPPNEPAPPPAPWSDWDEVRRVRQALRDHRYHVGANVKHLPDEVRASLAALCDSAVGAPLRVAHEFAQAWFAIWRDESGHRRPVDDARQRFERLRANAGALSSPPLARLCAKMTDDLFTRLSPFLRDPTWEATSNGAERAGRVFRHLGAPRFRLRTARSIGAHLAVHAQGRRHRAEGVVERPGARSRRGRQPARPDPRATVIASTA